MKLMQVNTIQSGVERALPYGLAALGGAYVMDNVLLGISLGLMAGCWWLQQRHFRKVSDILALAADQGTYINKALVVMAHAYTTPPDKLSDKDKAEVKVSLAIADMMKPYYGKENIE